MEWEECDDLDEGVSPPVTGYWVSWRIGGNQNLAFKDKQYYPKHKCVECASDSGSETLRRCIVTGLSSGVTYEFRVAGENDQGIGEWTKNSTPISTKKINAKITAGPLPTRRTIVVESGHPYRPCEDVKTKVLLKGCKFGAHCTFDPRTKLEIDADILTFYDDDSYNFEEGVMTGRGEDGDEVGCIFDAEFKTDKEAFQPMWDLCLHADGVGELGIDKNFHYGFFSDEHNQYWGYRFTLSWDDWSEPEAYAQAALKESEKRTGKRAQWLMDVKSVKALQVEEEAEKEAAKIAAAELRKKLQGVVIVNGKETVLPVSNITPRFMDGTTNTLVAPVRKQQLPMFPSYGGRRNDEDSDDDEMDDAENGIFTPEKMRATTVQIKLDLSLDISAWRKDAKQQQQAIIDQKDIVGSPDQRQIHFLKLKSAYRGYCAAGEPLYTCVDEHLGAHCADYILASEEVSPYTVCVCGDSFR